MRSIYRLLIEVQVLCVDVVVLVLVLVAFFEVRLIRLQRRTHIRHWHVL